MNLGYTYYNQINGNNNLDFGKKILSRANKKLLEKDLFDVEDSFKITFKTNYPGLAIGLGYEHLTKENDDYKLGFMFDHTSGLPYIPSSSIKGILRSVFPINETDEKGSFIKHLLEDKTLTIENKQIKGQDLTFDDIKCLEISIFGYENESRKDNKKENSNYKLNTQDIFLDGYISKSESELFLGSDYITPHKNPIKNPEPLKFLKILPNVHITLQFYLKDNPIISNEDKIELFKNIILFTGIGAKTNVGYGQFQDENIKFFYKNIYGKSSSEIYQKIRAIEIEYKIKEAEKIKEQEKQNYLLSLTPLERFKKENDDSFDKMLNSLIDGKIGSNIVKEVEQILLNYYKKHKNWNKPEKNNYVRKFRKYLNI